MHVNYIQKRELEVPVLYVVNESERYEFVTFNTH